VDPDDVVEEEIVAISRRQPLMREAGPADHHCPQFSDFGMDAKTTHCLPPSTSFSLSARRLADVA
jgi:hypothetical protein